MGIDPEKSDIPQSCYNREAETQEKESQMISEIQIENFQSHKNSKLELHPGINAIIGVSNRGKSAVLRALYWAITNRPTGDGIVSHWAMEDGKIIAPARVSVKKVDGQIIRFRNKTENGYEVNGEKLKAIRTDVPESVQTFFNLSDVNIQRQLDAPFLLSQGGTEIARFFNRIIRLEDIDRALAFIDKRRRDTRSSIETLSGEISAGKERLKRFETLTEIKDSLQWTEDQESVAVKQLKSAQTIHGYIAEAEEESRKIKALRGLTALQEPVSALETEYAGKIAADSKKEAIEVCINGIRATTASIERAAIYADLSPIIDEIGGFTAKNGAKAVQISTLRAIISEVNQNNLLANRAKSYAELSEVIGICDKFRNKRENIQENIESIGEILESFTDTSEKLKIINENMKKYRDSLPDSCPTCGAAMNTRGSI